MTCDGLASRPGEVGILAASCYRNRDKLRQLWASLGSKASLRHTPWPCVKLITLSIWSSSWFSLNNCCFFFVSVSLFGIVPPYPLNIYPIEFTSAQVTCVAFDAAGVKVPEKILFMRRDEFQTYVELKPNENLNFDNRSTLEGTEIYLYNLAVHCMLAKLSLKAGNYD